MNTYILLDLEQGSKKWLDFRKNGIGASDVAAIMKKDPWVSPLMKFEEKVIGKERPSNPAMRRGQEEEPKARAWINEDRGVNYKPVMAQSLVYDWLFCSLDGFDESADPAILEIKTPGKQVLAQTRDGIISPGYIIQCQTQMFVMNKEKLLFVAWDGQTGRKILLQRDDKLISEIEASLVAFRKAWIDLEPPEPSAMDEHLILDGELDMKAERLRQIDQTMNQLEVERESLKGDLMKACGDHSISVINGFRISQFMRKGNVDYSAIPELKNVNIEQYRKKPSISWRFSCKP